MYCLTIPEHIENIKILHMRTQKMNVEFILLGSILAKRNYDSNVLCDQKKFFQKIVKLCFFSTINALKRHFSTLFGIPFFSLCCSRSALSILFQRDMKNTVFIRGFMGSAPSWIPSFFREKIMSWLQQKEQKAHHKKHFSPVRSYKNEIKGPSA